MDFLNEYKKEIICVCAFLATFAMWFFSVPFSEAPALASSVWLGFGKFKKE